MVSSMDEEIMLGRLVERLRSTFDLRRVVLFGSRANLTANADSDVDLLVIVESDLPYRIRQGRAHSSVYKLFPYSLDLIVLTPEEASRMAGIPFSVVGKAMAEGELLYAA
jgi:uncharacterized protein